MPFDNLAETLLRGGIAPRHVRRYLAELREHLEDLTAQQCEAGHAPEDAAVRARARLGSDDELAAAMLEQKQFRSLAARAPWVVFILLPPFAAIAIGMLFIGTLVLMGKHYGFPGHGPLPPQWFQNFATHVVAISNLAVVPLSAALFVAIAARQRLKLVWPFAATLLLLILVVHADVRFLPHHKGHLTLGLGAIFRVSEQKMMLKDWPLATAQSLLTSLPFLWLFWTRKRIA